MAERDLQAACLRWARGHGLLALNTHGSGWCNKGFPDLLVLHDGRAVAVELKSPTSGYRPQPDQMVWRRRLLAQGVRHEFVSSVGEFAGLMGEEFGDATG